MTESNAEKDQTFKIRDHVSLLQYAFQDLLQLMIDTIGRISRDASIDPEMNVGYTLFKYEEIPNAAETIVSKCLLIDALIDEAQENTFLSKELPEIYSALKDLSNTYEENVKSLSEELDDANVWNKKITQIIDVVSQNTPWLSQTRDDDDDDEDDDDDNDDDDGKKEEEDKKEEEMESE